MKTMKTYLIGCTCTGLRLIQSEDEPGCCTCGSDLLVVEEISDEEVAILLEKYGQLELSLPKPDSSL